MKTLNVLAILATATLLFGCGRTPPLQPKRRLQPKHLRRLRLRRLNRLRLKLLLLSQAEACE